MRPLLTLIIIVNLVIPGTSFAAKVGWHGPDFIATQHSRDPDGAIMTGQVLYSSAGSRIEMDSPVGKTIAAANFKTGQCWFASERLKIFIEGKLEAETGDCDAELHMGSEGDDVVVGGLLARAPCDGFAEKKQMGSATVAGRATEVWACADDRAGEAKQWFDSKLKIVIKDDSQYSKDDLSEFKFQPIDAVKFNPPVGYKKVEKLEFMQALMGAATQ